MLGILTKSHLGCTNYIGPRFAMLQWECNIHQLQRIYEDFPVGMLEMDGYRDLSLLNDVLMEG